MHRSYFAGRMGKENLILKGKNFFFFRFDKMTNRYFDLLSIDPWYLLLLAVDMDVLKLKSMMEIL